jgi:hypothetical protein
MAVDFQNRHGVKMGSGEVTYQDAEVARKERLRKLAMEMIDLDKVRGRGCSWAASSLRAGARAAAGSAATGPPARPRAPRPPARRTRTCGATTWAASSAVCA